MVLVVVGLGIYQSKKHAGEPPAATTLGMSGPAQK
jgi:hypothetical protein